MVGAQCGLTPTQVLDMNLVTYSAAVEGYQEHLFDLRCIAVFQGYWAGYYGNSKHPKSLSTVLSSMMREHKKAKKAKNGNVSKPKVDVDVDAFLQKEQKLKARLKK